MKNIAIIGSGISGLTSAHLLSQKHNVTVYEKNDYIGGHTATIDIELDNQQYLIDSGFIVFNNKTYPNFIKLLNNLGVSKQETEMSFSVHNTKSGLEYNGHTLDTLFAQRGNLFSFKFWRLLYDVVRFNKLCKAIHQQPQLLEQQNISLGEFLKQNNFNAFFAEHYVLPMAAAIWSSSLAQMEQLPFTFFVNFFNNHGLLNITDRPQWYVIEGGSRSYIEPLCASFADNIHLNSKLVKITRENGKVQLYFNNANSLPDTSSETQSDTLTIKEYDEVVIACHSDEALALLADPSMDEQRILSNIPYSSNSVVMHTDTNLLPKRPKAWASWNYQLTPNRETPACVTYNMNILQGLKTDHTFCVTLNQKDAINPDKILREFTYHHPVFSHQSINAQQQRSTICGQQHTHFAGAYWANGFHEDGVKSGVEVGARFDCHL